MLLRLIRSSERATGLLVPLHLALAPRFGSFKTEVACPA
jgi:hypothetical protein